MADQIEPENRIKVLCLGSKGSGKTMLLKRLLNIEGIDSTYSPVPTVGTDIYELRYKSRSGKKMSVLIREVGGVMAPLWHSYLDGVKKVIFVVDTSNLCQISSAAVLLYTLLAEPKLQSSKVLLVLAKMDVAYRQMRNEALIMLQLKRLTREVSQQLSVLETSAVSGVGVDGLTEWITRGTLPQESAVK